MVSSGEKKQHFLCYSNWSRGDCRASFVLVTQAVLSAVPRGHNLTLPHSLSNLVFSFSRSLSLYCRIISFSSYLGSSRGA